ncbi:hypothetical protein [Streptomyces sp. NPDC059063]|uniref:hypothetical protein n=1 Tax=unclassified Streptomyces TaxID=2593676 RepID=UPI0036B2D049
MRVFDSKRQEWVGAERERQLAVLHTRDAVRQRTVLRGAVAVLAACGLAFGTWAVGWKDEPEPTVYFMGPETRSSAGLEASGSDGGSASSPAPSSSSPGDEAPPGYETVSDPEGFRVAVPIGWTRTSVDAEPGVGIDIVNYRNFDATRRLQVYEVSEATPYASLTDFLDDTKVPKSAGFRKLALERLSEGDRAAARLTYTTDRIDEEPEVGAWYVVDQRFEGVDGKLYAIAAYGADAEGRGEVRELLAAAIEGFCPPASVCG